MKPLLPRMTLDEAAVAMTERTVDNWTARDILGAGARQEITIHAKIPIGMKMVRCEPIEAGPNETEMAAGVLFPLDFNTVTRLLVGPDVEVKELHGLKRLFPNLNEYGTGPEWEIAEGETAPRVTASDCWILDCSLERLISGISEPHDTPAAKPETAPATSPSGDDWIEKARAIADRIGLERYSTGTRQITGHNICDAVATELALDETTWGLQGARGADNVRTAGLREWKFIPPKKVRKVD